jgi:hypothetical protein
MPDTAILVDRVGCIGLEEMRHRSEPCANYNARTHSEKKRGSGNEGGGGGGKRKV